MGQFLAGECEGLEVRRWKIKGDVVEDLRQKHLW